MRFDDPLGELTATVIEILAVFERLSKECRGTVVQPEWGLCQERDFEMTLRAIGCAELFGFAGKASWYKRGGGHFPGY